MVKIMPFFIAGSLGAKLSRFLKKKKTKRELSSKGHSRDAHIQGCTKDADNILHGVHGVR